MPATEPDDIIPCAVMHVVDEPLEADITFEAPYQQIHLEIEPDKQREYGLTVGSEGMGCEFFSEKSGQLYSMALDLNPYEDVDLTPPGMLEPLIERAVFLSQPGRLRLTAFPTFPINADGIWVKHDFSTALLSFGDLVIDPLPDVLGDLEAMYLVEIGRDVLVGFDEKQGMLQLVLVRNFDREQTLFGHPVSEVSHGAEFMRRLRLIHTLYYSDSELPEDAPNPLGDLVVDERLPDADLLRQLVDFYVRDLDARRSSELIPR